MAMIRISPSTGARWRKVAAALPAIALVGAGTALAATGGSSGGALTRPAARVAPSETKIQVPALPVYEQATFLQSAIATPLPALQLPAGFNPFPAFGPVEGATGSDRRVILDRDGIPAPALAAYRRAAGLLASAAPGCGIDWVIPAAIGRVESNHARFGGNQLDQQGVARPGIIGIALDGSNGTARITDSDRGVWDRDTSYDRAVGPMQFIPGTWRVVGADSTGKGYADPQDMNDAATAAAVYLCSGRSNLTTQDGLYRAIFRYNQSDSYVKTVIALANAYRNGVTELPVSQLPAATTGPAGGSGSDSGFAPAGPAPQAAAEPQPSQPPAETAPAPAAAPAPQAAPAKPAPAPAPAAPPAPLPKPVATVTEAAKAVVPPPPAPVVTTLQRLPADALLAPPPVSGVLPAPPADLTQVFRAADPANPTCYVKGPTVGLAQQYVPVACPPNTR